MPRGDTPPTPPPARPRSRARRQPIQVADLFCGAGGSSTAAALALTRAGLTMQLVAVNHWDVAVATHQANHPAAVHICQDLEQVKPRDAVPGGKLDLLLASPECIFHSRARGGRPIQDQRRATAWCVQRWCADLYVRCLIVENVPEFADWGPIDARGRPIAKRRGETFRAWCAALEAMGYKLDRRVLNFADYGDPTTRRRLMIIGRRDGRRLVWPESTHSADGAADLLVPVLGQRRRWRPARDIIDWSRRGRSVFTRKTPLRPNTLRRLAAGVDRFFGELAPHYRVMLELELERSAARWGDRPRLVGEPCRVEAAALGPLIGSNRTNNVPRPVDRTPAPTVTTSGNVFLVEPWLLPQGTNGAPVPALVTHGRPALVQPFLLGQHAGNAARPVDEPVMTLCAGGAVAIAEPFLFPLTHTQDGNRSRSVDRPLPTVTCAHGGELGLAEPLIAPYYSTGSPTGVGEPLETLTTKARFGVAEPFLVPNFGERPTQAPRTHSIDALVPAVTSHGAGGIAQAFMLSRFGDRPTGGARAHSIEAPATTVTARGAGYLVEAWGLDLLFRMLDNDELAGAHSFPVGYAFSGTKTEITRQIGNSNPINMMAALVAALVDP